MSTMIGIGLGRRALTAAIIDPAGIPRALSVGEGADSLRCHLLSLDALGNKLRGSSALFFVLKQPGIQLDQVTCVQSAGNSAIQLLSESLAHAHAQARIAAGAHAPTQFTVALDADCEFRAGHVREAAARALLPLSAVIDRAAALCAYLRWWLPASLQSCRLISVENDGRVSHALVNRSRHGGIELHAEQQSRSLPALLGLHSSLRNALEAHIGPATRKGAEILERIAEQLLLGWLGADNAANRRSECVQHVRGKEVIFAVPETAINGLLHELAETIRSECLTDAEHQGQVDATILSCAFLSEDLRARLFELSGAQPLVLPRNAQACLAFGAALAGTARQADYADPPLLCGTLGMQVGDRQDTSKQRFMALLDSGSVLPAEVRRSFYARAGARQRLIFDFVLRASPHDLPLGRVVVPLAEVQQDHHEVRLRVRVSTAGECRYALLDAHEESLSEGFIGTIDLAGAPTRVVG